MPLPTFWNDLLPWSSTHMKMSLDWALYVTSEACRGLGYAHALCDDSGRPMRIVHRDVSPQNILVSYEGEIKVDGKSLGAGAVLDRGDGLAAEVHREPQRSGGVHHGTVQDAAHQLAADALPNREGARVVG